MKQMTLFFGMLAMLWMLQTSALHAQNPVGQWKLIEHKMMFNGEKLDAYERLKQQIPCAVDIVYEVKSDGSFRLNASKTTCDERYKAFQERLYAESTWTINHDTITLTNVKPAGVLQTYHIQYKGNTMIWTSTDKQGFKTFERIVAPAKK